MSTSETIEALALDTERKKRASEEAVMQLDGTIARFYARKPPVSPLALTQLETDNVRRRQTAQFPSKHKRKGKQNADPQHSTNIVGGVAPLSPKSPASPQPYSSPRATRRSKHAKKTIVLSFSHGHDRVLEELQSLAKTDDLLPSSTIMQIRPSAEDSKLQNQPEQEALSAPEQQAVTSSADMQQPKPQYQPQQAPAVLQVTEQGSAEQMEMLQRVERAEAMAKAAEEKAKRAEAEASAEREKNARLEAERVKDKDELLFLEIKNKHLDLQHILDNIEKQVQQLEVQNERQKRELTDLENELETFIARHVRKKL